MQKLPVSTRSGRRNEGVVTAQSSGDPHLSTGKGRRRVTVAARYPPSKRDA